VGFVTGRRNTDRAVYKIRVEGGAPVRVTDIPAASAGLSWTENGTILLGGRGGIWEVDESGGSRRLLFSLPDDEIARSPVILPGGAMVLFERDVAAGQSVVIGDLRSGDVSTLVPNGESPRYLSTGHLTYFVGATLMAAPFEAGARALAAEPLAVINEIAVQRTRFRMQGGVGFRVAVSTSGTLAYFSERFSSGVYQSVVLVDPSQRGDNRRTTVAEVRVSNDLRVSPDETRFALQIPGGESDIWIYDFERGTTSRLTFDPRLDETPVWSSDGRYIAFAEQRERRTIFRVPVDGSEDPEPLWDSEYHVHVNDWSPDGRWIVLEVERVGTWEIWLLDVDEGSEAKPLLATRFRLHSARVSPDGSYLAYVSNESGREEIYVQRFPDLGDKQQISNDGGAQPVWARDGQKLFYRSLTHMMAVDVSLGPPFAAKPPNRSSRTHS
jgi:serine/threonine-protein kinase